jgi:hypothetical protein
VDDVGVAIRLDSRSSSKINMKVRPDAIVALDSGSSGLACACRLLRDSIEEFRSEIRASS